jgi:hypothetical protein
MRSPFAVHFDYGPWSVGLGLLAKGRWLVSAVFSPLDWRVWWRRYPAYSAIAAGPLRCSWSRQGCVFVIPDGGKWVWDDGQWYLLKTDAESLDRWMADQQGPGTGR